MCKDSAVVVVVGCVYSLALSRLYCTHRAEICKCYTHLCVLLILLSVLSNAVFSVVFFYVHLWFTIVGVLVRIISDKSADAINLKISKVLCDGVILTLKA